MGNRNKSIFLVMAVLFFMLFVGVMGVLAYVFIGGGSIPGIGESNAEWYACDIAINEPVGFKISPIGVPIPTLNPELGAVNCQPTGRGCHRRLHSIQPFWFGRSGQVQVWDSQGKVTSKEWDTGWLSGQDSITIEACLYGTSKTIKLTDSDGNVIDTKVV